jgi:molybdenum cofactor cytidylyltransferase
MDVMDNVAGILLAAGSSQRFGADKQSALVDGIPMLTRAASTMLNAGFDMPIVVLGARAAEHGRLLYGLPVRIVRNEDAAAGMASSLLAGLEAAGECAAVCIAVCDQPAVTAGHLRMLVTSWRKTRASIVASSYDGVAGVPAVFGSGHFAELRELRGDRGAGPLLARYAASLQTIPLPGGNIDIDTPGDLAQLCEKIHRPVTGASLHSSPCAKHRSP